ncbi:MAG: hypothetical protein QXF15_00495 [Candidatus Aenigmatarchaeota archaeon]|nr:hypothetical protein [Candidatus Aenigmarchaeota archaeon]
MKHILLLILLIIVFVSACIQQGQNTNQTTMQGISENELNEINNELNENEEFLNEAMNTEFDMEVNLT